MTTLDRPPPAGEHPGMPEAPTFAGLLRGHGDVLTGVREAGHPTRTLRRAV